MNAAAEKMVTLVYAIPASDDRWELEEENVPESVLHQAIAHLLLEILLAWAQRTGRSASVGSNLALRWDPKRPKVGVDPDVYVIEPALPEGEDATSVCTWKPGHTAPRVAVEIVSESTADKDYDDGPERYAASGTKEVWIFDPMSFGPARLGGPFVLQVWSRDARGNFERVYAGDGPARTEELDAWLVVTDGGRRVRVSDDADGTALWPTASEAAQASTDAALAEVARLRAELDALRGG